ncbi:MAG: DUF1080 domain-containing protein [Bryobacteraceae bacterium]|nr:DUF1080 domain-containing protein [Bryobacteraceae bacterium]
MLSLALLLALAVEPGFTSLFDGKTLAGWSIQEGPESAFYVRDGAIVVHRGSNFPTWLRSEKQYENFDFRGEYFVQGWINSGIYLHAPEHGRNTETGLKIAIFHQQDQKTRPESNGAIFPLIPPTKVNVRNKGEWNSFRILMDWPRLQVWMNDEQVQDVDLESHPELRYRLRRGYIGFESLSYPIRFRNLRIKELPSKESWEILYGQPEDLEKNWYAAEGTGWEALNHVLRAEGLGYLATKGRWRDFELHTYVRASKHSNGGILFRTHGDKRDPRDYEIQLHDVQGATYPTGSLYHYKRAKYPLIEPEKWFLLQLIVRGKQCIVRINGETVVEYDDLTHTEPGRIMIQAHDKEHWIEYKDIRIKALEP